MKELIKTAQNAQNNISGGEKLDITYNSTIIDDVEIVNESNYKALVAVPTVESTASDFLDYFTVTHSRTDNLNLGVNTTSESQKLTLTLNKPKKKFTETLNIKNIEYINKNPRITLSHKELLLTPFYLTQF